MRVTLAPHAGFCYGVKRAVELAQALAGEGRQCAMLGSLIHNEDEIRRLKSLGLTELQSPEEAQEGQTVLIRSHGEGQEVYRALERRGARVADATCPNVSRIHAIVAQAQAEGRQCVVIGTPGHPEITAIQGWCQGAKVFQDGEELEKWLLERPENREGPITMVSQTTAIRSFWDSCGEKAKKLCTNLKIFDTICGATCRRQQAAQELAAESDAMIVIGDRKSSNTRKLAQLCRALCPTVLWIERGEELDPTLLRGSTSVGITAGASTPGWIIKEVYDKMSEENIEIEESFAEMLEKSIKTLNTGEKVTGVVTGITPTEIYVDLGTKHAGYIPVAELTDDPTAKVEDLVKVGEEIETYVVRVNDQEGVVTLSKKRLDSVKSWDDVARACEEHTTIEGVVTEENKGGVVVSVRGVRVFVPASQTGVPRETPLTELVHKKVHLRVTEVNRARHRVVGSIRAAQAEERAAKAAEVWENIEEGKRYTGVVKSLTSYGAFVDIGGVDGMVHISELSWSRIKHPSEVVKVGDSVEVYVLSFDKEKKKISLGMKDRSQDPWQVFTSKYGIGDTANVRVVKLMTFGAFAEVVPGVDGLIHISQIADHRIDKPGDVLKEGQMVDVKITDVDFDRKKISLSIRALLEDAQRAHEEAAAAETEEETLVATSDSEGTEVAPAFHEEETADEPESAAPAGEAE